MIPNIIHFIYGLKEDFGGKPFSLVHYLAIKSAFDVNKPDKIFFYYSFKPSGEWWNKSLQYLTLVEVKVPRYIYWNKLSHFAHKADVLRLNILKKNGGIYLDMDTICVKPLNIFFSNDFILGKQGGITQGLCNAVMLSSPGSKFIKKWLFSYVTFRSKGFDSYWDEHSVLKPKIIAQKNPEILKILDEKAFHYPNWEPDQLKLLFEENHNFPEAFVHHLWESASWDKYLSQLTIQEILEKDTSFNLIARRFL